MNKQKKGFTLIELMVVIVIIGILAAIAIPKLFGMSAKAKASEVGPAAGTWSKLQAAYLMENSKLGSVGEISYRLPGATQAGQATSVSSNFSYAADGAANLATSVTQATWQATPLAGMGDCSNFTGSTSWQALFVSTLDAATGIFPSGASGAAAAANPANPCDILTPNFARLQ